MTPQIAMISPTEPKVNEDIALSATEKSAMTCNKYIKQVSTKTRFHIFILSFLANQWSKIPSSYVVQGTRSCKQRKLELISNTAARISIPR